MFLDNKNNLYLVSILSLLLIHLIAHFIPFERLSISPDDFAHHEAIKNMNFYDIIFKWTDRPLHFAWAYLVYNFIGYNAKIATILLFFISFIPTVLAFFIFKELLKSFSLSFLLSIIFLIIPNKLEIYHTLVFVHINIVMSLYLLSILLFFYYLKKNKTYLILLSFFFYSIGIFWYEAGFFLPLLYLLIIIKKKNFFLSIKIIFPFFLVGFIYLLFRYTAGFNLGENISGREININLFFFTTELFNSFLGRYMIRSIVYGLYNFINIPKIYLLILLCLNIIFGVILYYLLNRIKIEKIETKIIFIGILLIFITLAPNLFSGSIGGRNLVIPALGFSIILYAIILSLKKIYIYLFIFFFIFGMIVSQGNNWAQVVASRINNAIYEQLVIDRKEILSSETIIIDINSFAKNIPFTLVDRDFNILNTYYGAQALEDWGLYSMVKYVLNKTDNKVFISYSSPIKNNENEIEFLIKDISKYRNNEYKKITINNKKIYIINYSKTYKDNFNNGKFIFK